MQAKQHTSLGSLTAQEREAMEYVRDIRGFYLHALSYVLIVATLAVVNLWTNPDHLWFLWTALGWGIGVLSHGLGVFEVIKLFGDDWEKRQIAKRLRR